MLNPHALRPPGDSGNAGAGNLHQAERNHECNELLDLVGLAGQFENEAFGRGIDDARTECFGKPQRLDPLRPRRPPKRYVR